MVFKIKHKIEDSSLEALKELIRKLYREYEAIYTLINAMTVDIRKEISISKNNIARIKNKNIALKNFHKLDAEVTNLRTKYGIKVNGNELIKLVEKAENAEKGSILLVPKSIIGEAFSNYKAALPDFDTFPEHMRIGIDVGIIRERQGTVELFLLETILFEDMCAIFNLSKEYAQKASGTMTAKKLTKIANSLYRATVTTAFFFVEAYLNGLAADYYSKNRDRLDAKTKALLTEWDSVQKKNKYLSLRDKALQYPRIILGTQHSPLQENNCQELKFMVNKAKDLRDAIVHASALPDLESYNQEKESVVFNINYAEVVQVVDNAIALVRRLETTIYGNDKRLFWLIDRNAGGIFPETVFK